MFFLDMMILWGDYCLFTVTLALNLLCEIRDTSTLDIIFFGGMRIFRFLLQISVGCFKEDVKGMRSMERLISFGLRISKRSTGCDLYSHSLLVV